MDSRFYQIIYFLRSSMKSLVIEALSYRSRTGHKEKPNFIKGKLSSPGN